MKESVEEKDSERLSIPELKIGQISVKETSTAEKVKFFIDMDERIPKGLEPAHKNKQY
ncbi:hypothetical protein AA0228_1287 [Gluconobacter frateurii NRIC 0228]|uniref:Uncharacterized protein n=1 Tax=Gluconobacter frateurii NRIC 0228 TaxID=1307946 RepID=A0ABQ0QAP0_9PROT|nr:hypothetical protein AA0228_1287 [Gluconobacter frateurii NRIC 0228]